MCLAAMYYLGKEKESEQWTASELKAELVSARVPKATTFNVADVLGKAGHLVATAGLKANGNLWRLTESGDAHVKARLGIEVDAREIEIRNDAATLELLIGRVADEVVRGYLEESVLAYSVGALRAAVVFLWSGAIRELQEKALTVGVGILNSALVKHDPKARHVDKVEDFAGVKDVTQLLAFREIGLIDKGQWATLGEALGLRNRCGHPTRYKPGVKKTGAFIEDLVGIVF